MFLYNVEMNGETVLPITEMETRLSQRKDDMWFGCSKRGYEMKPREVYVTESQITLSRKDSTSFFIDHGHHKFLHRSCH